MSSAQEIQKDLKVKIPRDLQVKLHSLKILHGKLICDVVAEALVDYFAQTPDGADRHAGPDLTGA